MAETYFSREISRLMAVPRMKDGTPLYMKVDNTLDFGSSGNSADSTVIAKVSANGNCGSPDNIKRLFITRKGVILHLHRPVRGSSSLIYSYNYSNNLADCIANNGNLRGFGFEAIAKPYVYQNIEEVYIDAAFLNNMPERDGYMFKQYVDDSGGSVKKAVYEVFNNCCGKNVASIASRYPRLHTIGYIKYLEEVYQKFQSANAKSSVFSPWIEYALKLGKDEYQKAGIVITLRNSKNWVENWSIKEGIYIYDRDILKPYAQAVICAYRNEIKKIDEAEKNAVASSGGVLDVNDTDSEIPNEIEGNIKGEVEKLLDSIYDSKGEGAVSIALKAMPDDMADQTIKELSISGYRRYYKFMSKSGK